MKTTPLIRPFSEWRKMRRAAKVSLRRLERMTGINRAFLSLLDRGKYLPDPEEARVILNALQPTAELFEKIE